MRNLDRELRDEAIHEDLLMEELEMEIIHANEVLFNKPETQCRCMYIILDGIFQVHQRFYLPNLSAGTPRTRSRHQNSL